MSNDNHGATRREFLTAGAGVAAAAAIGFNRIALAQDTGETVSFLVSFKIQAGKEQQAQALLTELTAAVEANEPGALAYAAHRATDDPLQITFFEVYRDQDALNTHRSAPHLQALLPKFGELFEPGATVVNLRRVAGFTRDS